MGISLAERGQSIVHNFADSFVTPTAQKLVRGYSDGDIQNAWRVVLGPITSDMREAYKTQRQRAACMLHSLSQPLPTAGVSASFLPELMEINVLSDQEIDTNLQIKAATLILGHEAKGIEPLRSPKDMQPNIPVVLSPKTV